MTLQLGPPCKAATLWQPFATLIGVGIKGIETRSWRQDYRGPLLVHAGRHWDAETKSLCRKASEQIKRLDLDPSTPAGMLAAMPWEETLGKVVAASWLFDIEQVPRLGWTAGGEAPAADFEWGDLSPGRQAWRLTATQALPRPVAWRGGQGLWDAPEELTRQIERVLDDHRNGRTAEGVTASYAASIPAWPDLRGGCVVVSRPALNFAGPEISYHPVPNVNAAMRFLRALVESGQVLEQNVTWPEAAPRVRQANLWS